MPRLSSTRETPVQGTTSAADCRNLNKNRWKIWITSEIQTMTRLRY